MMLYRLQTVYMKGTAMQYTISTNTDTHLQIGLICCVAKNDPELSTHSKLLANCGKDAKSGQEKDQPSFLTVHIELRYFKKQLWPYYVLVEKINRVKVGPWWQKVMHALTEFQPGTVGGKGRLLVN